MAEPQRAALFRLCQEEDVPFTFNGGRMNRFGKTLLALTLVLLMAVPALAAGNYPDKTINILNPFVPGGWLDLSLRPIIEQATKVLGVPVITTPTPGAGGSIGYTKAAQAKPDGYTLLESMDSTLLCSGALRDVRYTIDDFVPVAAYCSPPNAIIIREGETRFKTLDELIAYAKAHPGELSVGMSGMKNAAGAACGLLEFMTGISLKKVPFNGASLVNGAVATGHVDFGITQTLATSGITPLMTFGCKLSAYPDLPTAKELGYKYNWNDYTGIFVPKGTPQAVIDTLEKAFLTVFRMPEIIEALKTMKLEPAALNAKEFAAAVQEDKEVLALLIKDNIIQSERKAAK